VINGTENYTTVMLRNIPIKFTQSDMLSIIDKRHAVNYDFFYMPMDLKVMKNNPPTELILICVDPLQSRLCVFELQPPFPPFRLLP